MTVTMDNWDTFSTDIFINPEPIVLEECDLIISDFISPSKLQQIAGQDDLSKVESLEMVVNTTETTLGNFAQYLPALSQLKLSESLIPSVRDIGTSFRCLAVLWLSRCGLNDVDGITSMHHLRELFVAYNNIEDISPISFLDNLEVLDLEANKINDVQQIDYLSIMPHLTTLTLSANPICTEYRKQIETTCTFREYVNQKLPALNYLDDDLVSSSEERVDSSTSFHPQEEFKIISNAIKDGFSMEDRQNVEQTPVNRINCGPRPMTAIPLRPNSVLDSPLSTAIPNRPGSSGSEGGLAQQDDTSNLTFGDPICGNPINVLRNRRRSPLPATTFLNQEFRPTKLKNITRPATAIGIRQRPSRFYINRANSFEMDKQSASDSDSEILHTPKHNEGKSVNVNDNINHPNISPSPPIKKPLSPGTRVSPFRSPTPPTMSQSRPRTAGDIRRSLQLRRSLPQEHQSVDVLTINRTRFKTRESVQPQN